MMTDNVTELREGAVTDIEKQGELAALVVQMFERLDVPLKDAVLYLELQRIAEQWAQGHFVLIQPPLDPGAREECTFLGCSKLATVGEWCPIHAPEGAEA